MEIKKKSKDIWLNSKFQISNILKYTIKATYTALIFALILKGIL